MSLTRKINYYPLYDIYKDLYNGVLDSNEDLLETSYINLGNVLKKINPKIIILNHDFTTETRLMALVAKELGIPTVEIQHGMYPEKVKIFQVIMWTMFLYGGNIMRIYI